MFNLPLSSMSHVGQWTANCMELGIRTQQLSWSWWQEASTNGIDNDPFGLQDAFGSVMRSWWQDPHAIWSAQHDFWRDWVALSQHTAAGLTGRKATPVIEPELDDKRFRDNAWRCPMFSHMQQAYLLFARLINQLVDTEGLDSKDTQTAAKLEFFKSQWLDALAPANFPHSNPTVWRTAFETNGASLRQGLENLLQDFKTGTGQITMADPKAFTLGENIACTPGKVVYQNRLFQLIEYAPSTEQVYRRPLLVVPPWINKYYILDLQPENSFVRWLVAQGHTVFMISWVNPDESYAETTFEDYVVEGVFAALDAVEKATGESEVNTIGYCIGGTLLACALAVLSARNDQRIASATFFTTLLDFAEPGEIKVFIDEQQIQALERRMQASGYLDGRSMGAAFSLLRSNDLIWSFVINNYLLGKQPLAFDLLYWNADSTRMPAAMHSYYLRNMYLHNHLSRPGAMTLAGTAIDISKIKTPSYFLSAKDDHIAPWASTYSGARLFTGPVRFVLGDSGHIAGVVNPPAKNKYGYWSRSSNAVYPDDAEHWLQESQYQDGSWWPDWQRWVSEINAEQIPAIRPAAGRLEALEDAPGSYVAATI